MKLKWQRENYVLDNGTLFADKKLHGGHETRNQIQNPAHVVGRVVKRDIIAFHRIQNFENRVTSRREILSDVQKLF